MFTFGLKCNFTDAQKGVCLLICKKLLFLALNDIMQQFYSGAKAVFLYVLNLDAKLMQLRLREIIQ